MQAKLQEQLSPADAEVILGRLPERIRTALIARAAEIEYPIEVVVEMAIASFLDTEALGFADCKPGRGHKIVNWSLRRFNKQVTAPKHRNVASWVAKLVCVWRDWKNWLGADMKFARLKCDRI
jgi:hypothetical protein